MCTRSVACCMCRCPVCRHGYALLCDLAYVREQLVHHPCHLIRFLSLRSEMLNKRPFLCIACCVCASVHDACARSTRPRCQPINPTWFACAGMHACFLHAHAAHIQNIELPEAMLKWLHARNVCMCSCPLCREYKPVAEVLARAGPAAARSMAAATAAVREARLLLPHLASSLQVGRRLFF